MTPRWLRVRREEAREERRYADSQAAYVESVRRLLLAEMDKLMPAEERR